MTAIAQQESDLSAKLNDLLGQLGAEISQLPNDRTIHSWTKTEVLHAVCRSKDALIDVLRCAVRLSLIGDIDKYSRLWIDEALKYSQQDQELLERVEFDLVNECFSSFT